VSVASRPAEVIKVSIGTNGLADGDSPSDLTAQREHEPQTPVRRPDSRSHVRLAR